MLTGALKERMVKELRDYWSRHPRYSKDDSTLDIVRHIKGKYPNEERPQRAIIVKNSSGVHVNLSPDNFIAHLETFVFLAKVPGKDGLSAEWVKEDPLTAQANDKTFPSPPGVYYFRVIEADEIGGKFIVEPILSVLDENVMVSGTTGVFQNLPVEGTIQLYELPGNRLLKEGINYTVDYETGELTLTEPLMAGLQLSADYRFRGEIRGPFPLIPDHSAPTEALPGAIVVFGRRYSLNDEFVVIVNPQRTISAKIYGGKWLITLDIEVVARDVEEQEEILDKTASYIFGVLRPRLGTEGIEIEDLNLGGEIEELYNEEEEEYYYSALLSVTMKTDWEIHVPLPVTLRNVFTVSRSDLSDFFGLSDEDVVGIQSSLQVVESNGLQSFEDPYFSNRTSTFETVT